MDDEIIKNGPGRRRTQNTAEDALFNQGSEAVAAPTAVPQPNGSASLDEDSQRYMNEKSVADYNIDAMMQQYLTTQTQGILSNIPADPQYGYAWVTTNKTFNDNNISRKIQGWHECTWEDVQHLGIAPHNINTTRSADISEDLVSIQEMILMRIPLALRARILKHLHHDVPQEAEENVYAHAKSLLQGKGRNVMIDKESDSGQSLMANRTKRANFTGV